MSPAFSIRPTRPLSVKYGADLSASHMTGMRPEEYKMILVIENLFSGFLTWDHL
jgi:hypothetical protein